MYVFVAVVAIMLLETRPALAVVAFLLVLAPALAGRGAVLAEHGLDRPADRHRLGRGLRHRQPDPRNRTLAEAHEQLKAMAVEQERARFARDLHDLLGHSLTVITVKSELARRVMASDPPRAPPRSPTSSGSSREALADVRADRRGLPRRDAGGGDLLGPGGAGRGRCARGPARRGGRRAGGAARAVRLGAARGRDERGAALRRQPGPGRRSRPTASRSSTTGPWRRPCADGSGLAGLRERLADVGGRLTRDPSTAAASACTPRSPA